MADTAMDTAIRHIEAMASDRTRNQNVRRELEQKLSAGLYALANLQGRLDAAVNYDCPLTLAEVARHLEDARELVRAALNVTYDLR